MQLMNNYINHQKSNKDTTIKKLPTQTNQFIKKNTKNKNENEKNLKNPSIKSRRKPRCINATKKYFEPKKLKSYSHNKKDKNNQYMRNRSRIQQKQNMNKTICTDGYGNITKITDIHDRNLSAPYLKFQKNDEKKMDNNNPYKNIEKNRKNNIIKLKLRNRKNSDNQENHVQLDPNSLKENHDNLTINDDKLCQMTYNNDRQPVTSLFYKPNNLIDNPDLLTKKTLPEEDNNFINIHKNVLNIKNFYKNINNNNKKNNKKYKTRIDISAYNKDIETIKNKQEIIALLKEQLKTKDNNNNNKPKLNKTLNVSNAINIDQINNDPLSKNKTKKNFKSKKNINKTNYNNVINDSNKNPKEASPNRQAYTERENNTNNTNMNLSNSSNNKNATISTNVTNNNNGFGKNINLLSIYGGQTYKDKKDLKENSHINKNNNDLNNINQFNNEKTRNKKYVKKGKNFTKDDFINNKNNQLNNNIKNKDFSFNNNTINNNKNNNDKNNKQNYIYLQRPKLANDLNYLSKNINPNPLNVKNKNNNSIYEENRSKEKEKKIQQNKNINKKNNIYENHIIETNSFNNKYNSLNNDRYINLNDINKSRNEEDIKNNNISYDNTNKNKNKGDISKNDNIIRIKKNANSQLKKIISCKTNYIRNRSAEKGSDVKINISIPVKKHLTNRDFKNKSIYKIGVICKAGEAFFGQKKVNQDNYFNYLINDDMRFIGVCDGHGDYGEHVSKYLRENLPKELEHSFKDLFERGFNNINVLQKEFSGLCNNKINIETNDNSDKNEKNINDNNIFETIKDVFENTFIKTDRNLSMYCRDLNDNKKNLSDKNDKKIFNVEYSGSTCASILLKEKNINKIYVANVGDSRAIIIKELKNKNNDWVPHQLTRDHKPTEEDEAQRVLEYDGEIEKIEDEYGNWTGPLRVWVKGSDGPGLAMTRSFGDEVGTSVGVFSVPEVTEYKIKEQDRAIIIASDGLWEYMDNKQVTDIVKKLFKQKDPDIIVNKLYKESIIKWKLYDQGIDDITIICILLKST